MRYYLKNLSVSILIFSVLSFLLFSSNLYNSNLIQIVPHLGVASIHLDDIAFSILYNLLFSSVLIITSLFFTDKYSDKFAKGLLKSLLLIGLLNILLRSFINFMQWTITLTGFSIYLQSFLFVATEMIYAYVLFHSCFKIILHCKDTPQEKQTNKKQIIRQIITILILLIAVSFISAFFLISLQNDYVDHINKYMEPHLLYQSEKITFVGKMVNVVSVFLIQSVLYDQALIFYAPNFRSYEKLKKGPCHKIVGFGNMLILYFVSFLSLSMLISVSKTIKPTAFPYLYDSFESGGLSPTFGFQQQTFLIYKEIQNTQIPILDFTFVQLGDVKTVEVPYNINGISGINESQIFNPICSVLIDDITFNNAELAYNYKETTSTNLKNNRSFSLQGSDDAFYEFYKTDALIYKDDAGSTKAFIFPTGNHFDYAFDSNLTAALEDAVTQGYFSFWEGASDYLMKYDKDFMLPILQRLANGDLTQNETERNRNIKPDYIIHFAQEKISQQMDVC